MGWAHFGPVYSNDGASNTAHVPQRHNAAKDEKVSSYKYREKNAPGKRRIRQIAHKTVRILAQDFS